MTRTAAMTLVALLALLPGCALFSKKERPIDIGSDAPNVSDVIAQVQAAIDATAQNPGWQETAEYAKALAECAGEQAAAARRHRRNAMRPTLLRGGGARRKRQRPRRSCVATTSARPVSRAARHRYRLRSVLPPNRSARSD